jgi:hypothetical protein
VPEQRWIDPKAFDEKYETKPVQPKLQDSWTTTEIEDFILNRADVNQVSNIFARLGTRYAELAKAKVELTGLLD